MGRLKKLLACIIVLLVLFEISKYHGSVVLGCSLFAEFE